MDEPNPKESPSFLIKRLASELSRRAEVDLRPLNLGIGSLPALVALKNGEAMTQSDLARLLQVEQPSMAETVARLERDGLLRRTPHPSHKRKQLLELTEAGREALSQSKGIFANGNKRSLAGFTSAERQTLLRLLERMHLNLTGGPA